MHSGIWNIPLPPVTWVDACSLSRGVPARWERADLLGGTQSHASRRREADRREVRRSLPTAARHAARSGGAVVALACGQASRTGRAAAPERNGQLDPAAIAAGSNRKRWWRCAAGHRAAGHGAQPDGGVGLPRVFRPGHVRRLRVLARAQARVPAERSLAVKRAELVAERHPTRNRGVDPEAIGCGSRRKLWWRCSDCGHEWRATVSSRAIKGTGCTRCFMERHRQQRAERDRQPPTDRPDRALLGVRRPDLVAELYPTMNDEP